MAREVLHVSALSMRCHDHIPAETTRATVVATSFSTKKKHGPRLGAVTSL